MLANIGSEKLQVAYCVHSVKMAKDYANDQI